LKGFAECLQNVNFVAYIYRPFLEFQVKQSVFLCMYVDIFERSDLWPT